MSSMSKTIIEGKILEWGNSYGIRLKKADVEEEGLRPGEEITVRIVGKEAAVDLSDLPILSGGRSDVSTRHDEYLAKGLEQERRGRGGEGETPEET